MTSVATQGVWMPGPPLVIPSPFFASSVIDATGEKFAWIGSVWNKDRATKNITKVGFRFGTVTKAGGSALTVSLQDVNLAAGAPYQPDETQDQTVAIANADAGFVTGVWYQTGALSATRTVAFGELLAVVVEYDGAGRLGADTVGLTNVGANAAAGKYFTSGIVLKTASWATVGAMSNIILEFDDGTFGTLSESFPASALSTLTYNSGSAADEAALEFTVPFPCKIDGAFLMMSNVAAADSDIVLYDGTTPMATVAVDANTVETASAARMCVVSFAEQTLVVGTTYRLSLKPTTANNVVLYYFDVAAANHMQALPGGTAWKYTTRVDAGSWAAATATRRPWGGIRISALDDGAGGGGGTPIARPGLHAIEAGIS